MRAVASSRFPETWTMTRREERRVIVHVSGNRKLDQFISNDILYHRPIQWSNEMKIANIKYLPWIIWTVHTNIKRYRSIGIKATFMIHFMRWHRVNTKSKVDFFYKINNADPDCKFDTNPILIHYTLCWLHAEMSSAWTIPSPDNNRKGIWPNQKKKLGLVKLLYENDNVQSWLITAG